MTYSPSALYSDVIPDLQAKLHSSIENGLVDGTGACTTFFRADDIGVPSQMFFDMVSLFKRYNTPLCLAVVPTWLTEPRFDRLIKATGRSKLFCWHQHGWMHKNHEKSGKKQEFAESRTTYQLKNDIERGKKRLSDLIGNDFFPVFTPPWNRCGQSTLNILQELGFKAISRSSSATPVVSDDFKDFQVNVDLHTRKDKDCRHSFDQLCREIRLSFASGNSGIMLHHQRMNDNALTLLEKLLEVITTFKTVETKDFADLTTTPN